LITFHCFQYFQDRSSYCLAAPGEDENPRIGHNELHPYIFKIFFGKSLIYQARGFSGEKEGFVIKHVYYYI
jgi:hypothetical protein